MTGRLARSAAFWLRAYPPAWRAQRADEVTALLVDLAPDDARRLDARTALNLLRGGVATRWRQTPPLRVYLPYRLLDLRVPARYRDWVQQDISSPGYLRRNLMGRAWLFALPLYNLLTTDDLRTETLVLWTGIAVATVAAFLCGRPGFAVRRKLQHHLPLPNQAPSEPGSSVWVWTPRARIAAEPGARALTALLAVGAVAWSAAFAFAPNRLGLSACPEDPQCFDFVTESREPSVLVAAVLIAAFAVGVVLAAGAARRLRRRLPGRPDQPARRLVGLAPHASIGMVLWAGLIVAAALAEATGVWFVSVSALAGPACLCLLPSAVVLWRTARTEPDAALVDLRHVAWSGLPVEVDRHDTELVPLPIQETR